MTHISKTFLRQTLGEQRRQLPQAIKNHAASAIADRFLASSLYQHAQHIAVYLADEHEVNLQTIIHTAWTDGKHCYLPIVNTQHTALSFAPYHASTPLKKNIYGILEPQQTIETKPNSFDIVLAPLVAFDTDGNRLGRGAGHYDRTFSFLQNTTSSLSLFGIAYDFQKVPHIPHESWDIQLDGIITERTIYWRDCTS